MACYLSLVRSVGDVSRVYSISLVRSVGDVSRVFLPAVLNGLGNLPQHSGRAP